MEIFLKAIVFPTVVVAVLYFIFSFMDGGKIAWFILSPQVWFVSYIFGITHCNGVGGAYGTFG